MRKFIVFLLVFVLIFSSMASVAAPGDIIHTGLKRIYRKSNTSDLDTLLNDIINGADIGKFYEETSDGKYVNVEQKEKEQMEHLESLVIANNITTSKALEDYLSIEANKAEIDAKFNEISNSITKTFEEIADPNKGNKDDYLSSSEAPKLKSPTNYTIPVPGTEDNTIKIEKLVKPTGIGATKWLYKIVDTHTFINLNDILEGGNPYSQGNNIKISADKYLLLCATDSDNKVKSYASIKITAGMVKAPRIEATFIDTINVSFEKSVNSSGATVISGALDEGTWKMAVLNSIPDKVYVDSEFDSKDYISGMELVVASDVELDNNLDGFKKYIIVYSLKDGKIENYNILEIPKDKVSGVLNPKEPDDSMIKSPPPMELYPGTHYKDIFKGDNIGQTKITVNSSAMLDELFTIPVNITWRYVASKTPIAIPEMNGKVNDSKVFSSSTSFDIATESELRAEEPFNRYLMLLATEGTGEDYTIKGYAMIDINRNHVKYPEAKLLSSQDNYSTPVKGSLPGTTRITDVKNTGIDNHNAWWYKVYKGTTPPSIEFKESITRVNGFNNFTTTLNITIEPNDYIVLVSVDKENKALGYANIKVDSSQITATNAIPLKPIQNYEGPIPGSKAGSTKFTKLLNGSLTNVNGWMYKVGKSTFGTIETGADTTGYTSYTVSADIEGVAPNDRLLLVAVDSASKVIASTEITLTSTMIRGKDGIIMTEDNYTIEKGSTPSTTKLTNLNRSGIDGYPYTGWKWMYKVLDNELTGASLPYVNQKVDGALNYTEGRDIIVNYTGKTGAEYGYILLLATDSAGLTKAYIQIPVATANVKESAPKIIGVNLEPGNAIDRTKFIGLAEGNKYLYKIDTKPFTRPAVGDIVIGGTPYIVKDNIGFSIKVGNHIILYEVDNDNKVKAYCDFVVTKDNLAKGEVVLVQKTLLEGNIVNGGEIITFTLSGDDKWNDVRNDKSIRDKLFAGLKANNQLSEWSKVVNALQNGGSGYIFVDGKTISIRLPNISDYNITDDQVIQLVIPPEAIQGAINPLTVMEKITIKPTIRANISGTVVSQTVREKDIKAGGSTIVISLTDASWGLDVSKVLDYSYVEGVSESDQVNTNWNKIKTIIKESSSSIVATSDKVITITIPKVSDVSFGIEKETITLKISKGLIQGATEDVVASPSFTLYPDEIQVELKAVEGKELVIMQAPDNKVPLIGFDTWEIELTNTTFRDAVTDKDVSIVGLPAGLKPIVTRKSDTILEIKLTGTASSPVVDGVAKLRINGTAVKELNSVDSKDFNLNWKKGTPMSLENITYEIKEDGVYLNIPDDFNKIRYSLDSTNGINGTWHTIGSNIHRVNELIGPMKIYVHEIAQPKVFREIINLNHDFAPILSVKEISYFIDGNTGKVLQKVVLDGTVAELEYNTGNGQWHTLVDGTVSGLDSNSTLTVRKKGIIGISGILPSLPTNRLNGLFLGNVNLNVGDSRIDGATTQMQYSLNSDENGNGGSWNVIKAPNPVIRFANDNIVWIREGSSEVNKRELGKVSQAEALPDNIKDNIEYDILNKTITNKSDIALEYRIANGSWLTLDKRIDENTYNIVNNVIFVPGNIEVRRKGSSDFLPSTSKMVTEIPLPIAPPELRFDNDLKTIKYNDEGVFKYLDDNFEYKLGTNGDWKNGSNFSIDEGRNGDITVFVRKKPTKTTVASKEVSFIFTKNISFANVSVNVAGGYIDGTTTLMEYSTDSADGKNGTWIIATKDRTSIKFVPGMNLYIREKDKPSSFKNLFLDLKREEIPVLDNVSYVVSDDKISNNTNQNLDYRVAEGAWTKLGANSEKIPAGLKAGKLEFRKSATASTLESPAVTKTQPLDIIKVEASAPVVEINDTKNRILSINSESDSNKWSVFEYRVNSASTNSWSNGIHLSTEDLSGDKDVEIRIKATSTSLASKTSIVKFTKNLELDLVTLSDYTKPYELNGTTTDMEYKIIYLDGMEIGWKSCLKDTTSLTEVLDTNSIAQIILRDGRVDHRDNERIMISNADSAPTAPKIESYDYSSEGKVVVKLVGVDNTMEYRIGEDTWTSISSSETNVDLAANSDLRVRVKSLGDKPASIFTPRLNGLYLGNISIENSILKGTNSSIEYSLDGGNTWVLAKEPETPIKMNLGNIIKVRQLGSDINIRTIGTVTTADKPVVSEIDYSIKNGKIVAAIGLEYKIAEGPWISITENPVTKVVFEPGQLEFRTKSSGLKLASESTVKATIPNPTDTPELRAIDTGKKNIEYYDENAKVWKEIDDNFEYKVGTNGSWKPASEFALDPMKDGQVMLFARKVATHSTLPSNEKSVSLTFSNVRTNIASGVIENTTTSMEYSINSTNGLDGAWYAASNGNTSIGFVEGISIWVREKSKADNYVKLLSDLKRETNPSKEDLDFNIALGTISNKSPFNLEYRIKKGSWNKLPANATMNINFGEGSLEFRKAATVDKLESFAIEKFIILAAASSPVVTIDDVDNKIVSINSIANSDYWKDYQYRIVGEGENWIQGELLGTDIDLSSKKTIEIRRKSTSNSLPSQIAKVDFTENLELSHVNLSTHLKPLVLNGTTELMEYKVWLTNGINIWVFNNSSEWTKCDKDNTKLHESLTEKKTAPIYIHQIMIRDSRENQQENKFIIYPKQQ